MKTCTIIVEHGQNGDPCARNAHQDCSECGEPICDRHTYLCCDLMLCPGCLQFHKCRTAFLELTQCA
jgi:hypothetical protein